VFILNEQRGDVQAFDRYRKYLSDNRHVFPPHAYSLALSDWYYEFTDHKCPHDGWLISASLNEVSNGDNISVRKVDFDVTLLGAYHDLYITIRYINVVNYSLFGGVVAGHGDWLYDEFRLSEDGKLIHEIEWATSQHGIRKWVIECEDIDFHTRAIEQN